MSYTSPGTPTAATGTWNGSSAVGPGTPGLSPGTVPMWFIVGGNNYAIPSANGAVFMRSLGKGTLSKIQILVGNQSGNVCVGVYSSAGGISSPANLLTTSGPVPCPSTAAAAIIPLLTPVFVNENCYFALAVDNVTATFTGASASPGASDYLAVPGWTFAQANAFPLPAVANITASLRGQSWAMYGLP